MTERPRPIRNILVVDDEPAISKLLKRILVADGYHVVVAKDGQTALSCIAEKRPDLIILDIDMPHMSGLEVCQRIKSASETKLLPILILTGTEIADCRTQAWDLGADEFLTKPFHAVEVSARCRSLLRQKDLVDELETVESVVFALARSVEAKSRFTHGHSSRVTQYCHMLAERHGLGAWESERLRRGSILHDIGKISIPDAILNKPGPLTADEYELVKQHPIEGSRIVEPLRSAQDVIPLIRWHHERMDGKGYPDGIAEHAIPFPVRILAVADVYDALSCDRPYRPAMSHETCRTVMEENAAGGGLDDKLVFDFFEVVTRPLNVADHAS